MSNSLFGILLGAMVVNNFTLYYFLGLCPFFGVSGRLITAFRLGLATTGNAGGVRNLRIDPGSLDQAGLLREMGSGLLVTEMMGHGVNMVTGDYSRGASGFWVENGEIAFPVEEITVAGNLGRMFERLQAVGCDIDRRGSTHTGSWLVEGMTLAGQDSGG